MQKHKAEEKEKEKEQDTPLLALNHVSRVCRSVKESIEFYTRVLGFVVIKRPESFDFDGAWLFNYGVGIHLVQCKDEEKLPRNKERLDPMDNHISFQCEDMEAMVRKLEEMKIEYMKRSVGEGEGATIDQLFFKDPVGLRREMEELEIEFMFLVSYLKHLHIHSLIENALHFTLHKEINTLIIHTHYTHYHNTHYI